MRTSFIHFKLRNNHFQKWIYFLVFISFRKTEFKNRNSDFRHKLGYTKSKISLIFGAIYCSSKVQRLGRTSIQKLLDFRGFINQITKNSIVRADFIHHEMHQIFKFQSTDTPRMMTQLLILCFISCPLCFYFILALRILSYHFCIPNLLFLNDRTYFI